MEERVTEEEVLASINFREQLIERCKRVVQVTHGQNASHKGVTAREFVNLAKELRESGIRCVQKIVAWTLFNTESDSLHPKVFLWNEIEYLCKMLNDLDFIAESLPVTMKQHGGFRFNDPFFTKHPGDVASKRASATATLIVLDAVQRRKKQEALVVEADNREELDEVADHLSTTCDDDSNGTPQRIPIEFRKQRRTGVNDLYRSENLMDDLAESRATQTTKQPRGTFIESVVFRARKLYHRGKTLGSGSYATVYECERQDGMRFAVKVFNITAHASSSSSASAAEDEEIHYARKCYHRELDFLRSLSHPHIIAYEDSTVREGVPYVIVEKMNCTLLELQMDRTTQAPFGQFSPIELNSRIISLQLLDGLSYLHNLHIIHRDIKPENILVNFSARGIVAKFGDFGSAVRLPNKLSAGDSFLGESDLTHYVGSRWYRAPETIGCGTEYSYPSDIWSLGCTLAEFVSGDPLFQGETEQEVMDSIVSLFPDNQIPGRLCSHWAERGLTVTLGRPKRSIHIILSRVSSAFRRIIDSMIRLTEDERYNAGGLLSDVKELMIEV